MRKKREIESIAATGALFIWLLTACSSSPINTVAPSSITAVQASETASPTSLPESVASMKPWPLLVQMSEEGNISHPSVEQLMQVVPGKTDLEDLYTLVGHPAQRRDFPIGALLMYQSVWIKSPHVVMVDGVSGKVMMVAIENVSRPYFSMSNLKAIYGESFVADVPRDSLFFPGEGIATISSEANGLIYVLLLPREMTLSSYQEHQGFEQEVFAFTP